MNRLHGALLLIAAGATAFGTAHSAEQNAKAHTDSTIAGIAASIERLNSSLDRIIVLLESKPAATIDLRGQEQSMIVVLPLSKEELEDGRIRDVLSARGYLPNGLPSADGSDRGEERRVSGRARAAAGGAAGVE